jgi:hypothetical protein
MALPSIWGYKKNSVLKAVFRIGKKEPLLRFYGFQTGLLALYPARTIHPGQLRLHVTDFWGLTSSVDLKGRFGGEKIYSETRAVVPWLSRGRRMGFKDIRAFGEQRRCHASFLFLKWYWGLNPGFILGR